MKWAILSVQPEGESGIHSAVKNADIPMILILLDLGASIDRRDHQGNGYIYYGIIFLSHRLNP